jgi:hypothetical protein
MNRLRAVEWIVVIAEPDDRLVARVRASNATVLTVQGPNRGLQLNVGARAARGELLLFHHVDSYLTDEHVEVLRALIRSNHGIGGAFYRSFDARHPRLTWFETLERWHCRVFGSLYGDQSIFVRRDVFFKLGGFADIPLMEDIEFSRRLRRYGPITMLDPPMRSSLRRHRAEGRWRTTLVGAILVALFHLGVPPRLLHRFYYRRRLK